MSKKVLSVGEMRKEIYFQGDYSKKDQKLLDKVLEEIHELEIQAAEK